MKTELTAHFDKRGSETAIYNHYNFGRPGSPVNGGVYIKKDSKNPPDEVVITIDRKEEE